VPAGSKKATSPCGIGTLNRSPFQRALYHLSYIPTLVPKKIMERRRHTEAAARGGRRGLAWRGCHAPRRPTSRPAAPVAVSVSVDMAGVTVLLLLLLASVLYVTTRTALRRSHPYAPSSVGGASPRISCTVRRLGNSRGGRTPTHTCQRRCVRYGNVRYSQNQ
jgi:hypothetical protein